MLTAILFDDEKLALKTLEMQLSDYEGVKIIGMYTRYNELMAAVERNSPDIAFIDIETPRKSGLEIAQEIQNINSGIEIVFVTAHRQYAYNAFEIEALDYILKPAKKERLQRIISKVAKDKIKAVEKPPQIYINTMGKFEVRSSAGEIINWRTKKVQELLAYLVHHKGQEVISDSIIEALWPEHNLEKAKKLLYTTMYYLRKGLNQYGVEIIAKGQKYILLEEKLQCDIDILEDVISQINTSRCKVAEVSEKLFKIYKGGYLEEDCYEWAKEKETGLESRFTNTVMNISECLIKQDRLLEAKTVLKGFINMYPYNEYAYKKLMVIYQRMDNRQGLEDNYRAYVKIMTELGIPPERKKHLLYKG